MVTGHSELNAVIDKVAGTLMNTRDKMITLSAAGTDNTAVMAKLASAWKVGEEGVTLHDKAVQALIGTLNKHADVENVLHDAFKALTTEQLANLEVQKQLLPMFDKLVASGGALTQTEHDYYAAVVTTRRWRRRAFRCAISPRCKLRACR